MWPVLMSWSCLRGAMPQCGWLWGDVGWATMVSCDMACHVMSCHVIWYSGHVICSNVIACVASCHWCMRSHGDELLSVVPRNRMECYELKMPQVRRCGGPKNCSVLQSTTKYYSQYYYKVLHQYDSVLQSNTPVLLCTTKFYKVKYYNVLLQYYPSTTPVLLQYYSSTTLYYKVVCQCYSILQGTTPVLLRTTKYYSVLQSPTPVLLCTTKNSAPLLLCTT